MADMIATKPYTYATRRLKAGDEFTTSKRDGRTLAAIGKAKYATKVMAPAPVDDIAEVREEYERVVGRRPFNGWDIPKLRQLMAEAAE